MRAMPWWPGSPGPPWPCPAGWTTSGLEPGDGYSWDWSSPWRWAGGWAACAAVCWSACTPPSPLPPGPTGRGGRYGLPPRGPGRSKISGRLPPGCRAGPGGGVGQTFSVPGWLMLLCAAVMALGTAMGGRRIIETVGRDMVILAPRRVWPPIWGRTLPAPVYAGRPSSEHHSRQDRRHSRGRLRRRGTVNRRVAARIALTWLFTFPGCGLLGFCWPASSVPPLLWYTDARYDFLTFDTGGSNHVPLRHSHL